MMREDSAVQVQNASWSGLQTVSEENWRLLLEMLLKSQDINEKSRQTYSWALMRYFEWLRLTGRRLNGQPTQNMQDLQKNAMQNGFPHMPDYSKQPVAPSNQKAPVNSPTPSIQDKMTFQVIRQHDLLQSIGVDGFSWLKSGPLLSQEMNGQLYHLITMPDGVSGIIISDKEYREPILAKASGYENYGALICADRNYPLVDYKTGRIYNASGRQMIAQSRKMPIQDYEKKLEAMLQNQTQKKVLQESIAKAARGRQI